MRSGIWQITRVSRHFVCQSGALRNVLSEGCIKAVCGYIQRVQCRVGQCSLCQAQLAAEYHNIRVRFCSVCSADCVNIEQELRCVAQWGGSAKKLGIAEIFQELYSSGGVQLCTEEE